MYPGDQTFSPILMRHKWVGQAPSPIMKPMNKKNSVILQMAFGHLDFSHLVIPLFIAQC